MITKPIRLAKPNIRSTVAYWKFGDRAYVHMCWILTNAQWGRQLSFIAEVGFIMRKMPEVPEDSILTYGDLL